MDIYESDLTMTYKYAGKMVKNRLKHIMIAHASLNLSPYEGKTAPTLKLVGLGNQCSKQGSRQVGKDLRMLKFELSQMKNIRLYRVSVRSSTGIGRIPACRMISLRMGSDKIKCHQKALLTPGFHAPSA